MSLRLGAVGCHVLLGAAVAACILFPAVTPLRIGAAFLVMLPLLLSARGLVLGRRTTEQRVCVLLVLYIGGTAVEVVAQAGTSILAGAALLAAALELALVLVLIRRSRPRATAVHG